MKNKLNISFLFIAIFLIIIGVTIHACKKAKITTSTSKIIVVNDEKFSKMEPDDILRSTRAHYLLKPDARFLKALFIIDQLFSVHHENIEVHFSNKVWTIKYHNKVLGKLPQYPSFNELYTIVEKYAKPFARKLTLSAKYNQLDILSLNEEKALKKLQEIDKKWSQKNKTLNLVKDASNCFLTLLLSMNDTMETADIIPAKTIAALALTNDFLKKDTLIKKALLANILGYDVEAKELIKNQDINEIFKAFIMYDRTTLKKFTKETNRKPLTVLMMFELLRTTSRNVELKEFIEQLSKKDYKRLPYIATLIDTNINNNYSNLLAAKLLYYSLHSIENTKEKLDNPNRITFDENYKLLSNIDIKIKELKKQKRGAFLDYNSFVAYYRSYIYLALNTYFSYLIDHLSSLEAAENFYQFLGKGKSLISIEFSKYVNDRIRAKRRKIPLMTIINEIKNLSSFGAPIMYELYSDISTQGYYDLVIDKAIKEFSKRADTRPEHLDYQRRMAWYSMNDIGLTEELTKQIIKISKDKYAYVQIMFAYQNKNTEKLKKLLNSDKLTPFNKSIAMEYLTRSSLLSKSEIYQQYKLLLKKYPADYYILKKSVKFLEKKGDYEKAINLINDYLFHPERLKGVPDLWATSRIAQLQLKQGKITDAWETINPIMDSQYEFAYDVGALIRTEMDEEIDAVYFAKKSLQRYSDQYSATLLAKIYWKFGEYDKAAQAIKNTPKKYITYDWLQNIGKNFVEVFGDKPIKDAKLAFNSLIKARFRIFDLIQIARKANYKKKYKLAFELTSMFFNKKHSNYLVYSNAYTFLKDFKGKIYAIKWLKDTFPDKRIFRFSQYGYYFNNYEVPWEAVPDPKQGTKAFDLVWSFRAASYIKTGKKNQKWLERLNKHYRKIKFKTLYASIGGFMMGLQSKKDVLNKTKKTTDRAEAYYYFGLVAQSNRNFSEAVKWYRATLMLGKKYSSASHWAHSQLSYWADNGLSPSYLKTHKVGISKTIY